MRSRFPHAVLRAWEAAAAYPGATRGAALLASLEDPEAVPVDRCARLPIGERDARLLAWRERLFGSEIRGLVECPRCGRPLELSFTVPPFSGPREPRDAQRGGLEHEWRLELAGVTVDFRPLDTYDLSSAEGAPDAVAARARLLERCVVGARDGAGHVLVADGLSDQLVAELSSRLAALDPLVDVQLGASCDGCGHAWDAPFDVAQFLWSEIEAATRGLLADVHELATAYGWSEPDVLALTPERRQAYLELVRG